MQQVGVRLLALEDAPQLGEDGALVDLGRQLAQLGGLPFQQPSLVAQRRQADRAIGRQLRDGVRLGPTERQSLDRLDHAGDHGGGRGGCGQLLADAEVLELGGRVAELAQADLAFGQAVVLHVVNQLLVDEAAEPALVQADLEGVPLAGLVVRAGVLAQHLPAEHVRPLEPCQAQLAVGRVEAVVPIRRRRCETPGPPPPPRHPT